MAHVTVTINGKTYRMACEEGQEGHLRQLAEHFDGYVGQLKGAFGEIGDQRLTVMAAVMVTDELMELKKRVASLESDVVALRQVRDETLSKAGDQEMQMAAQIVDAAERLEAVAQKLKSPKSVQ